MDARDRKGLPQQEPRSVLGRVIAALKHNPWLTAVAIGLFTLLVFLPTVECDFVNMDDPAYVYENPLVLGGLSPAGIRRACTDVVFFNWAPLTILSYQLDVSLFGRRPWGFHLTNSLLHATSAALLFIALVRMTATVGRSAAAALLFAVHPLRVESVAWIAERKDVLSVLFLMVALVAYERYCRRPTAAGYLGIVAAMAASLLAKATAVTLPVLLVLLDIWPLRRGRVGGVAEQTGVGDMPRKPPPRAWRYLFAEKLPLFVLAAIFVVITLSTQARAIQSDLKMPLFAARLPNGMQSIAIYLAESLVPVGLHPVHCHPGIHGWSWPLVGCGVAAVVAIVLAGVALRQSVPAVLIGGAWFLVALSPVLGIVTQQGFQGRADRFTYVPHLGLFLAVVWAAAAAWKRLRLPGWVPACAMFVVLASCVLIDRRLIRFWKDSETLWNRVLAFDSRSFLAECSLGVALYERGELDDAMRHFQASLSIRDWEGAHSWLGLALADRGRLDEAIVHYRAALAFEPRSGDTHHNLGIALARLGRIREAIPHFEEAIASEPADPLFHESLSRARKMTITSQKRSIAE